MANRYLAFLWHAYNSQSGRFRNFMSYERRWLEEFGSKDSHARALWALGAVLGHSRQEGLRRAAGRLFEMALPAARDFTDLRSVAFTLFALHDYLLHFSGDHRAQEMRVLLAERFQTAWQENCAARVAVVRGAIDLRERFAAAGGAHVRPVVAPAGNDRGGARSARMVVGVRPRPTVTSPLLATGGSIGAAMFRLRFDQQPIEAQTTIAACIEAYRATGDYRWRRHARRAFQWFLGRNDVGMAMYDSRTGGGSDGLSPEGPSFNQGAESALAFLQSLVDLRLLEPPLPGEGHTWSAAWQKGRPAMVPKTGYRRVLSR